MIITLIYNIFEFFYVFFSAVTSKGLSVKENIFNEENWAHYTQE
ncbi:MAG: hypothetical protein SPK13_00815 [Treponema sp.]|nr:hypothetical protein [Treponema sp.]